MKAYVALFVVAAITSTALTPLVRGVALRVGAVSRPGGRNVNARAVPRLGGIAICVSFFVALGALCLSQASTAATIHQEFRRLLALVGGGVGLCLVGIIDDTKRVRALYKLYAQIAAATLAYVLGFRIDAIQLPAFGTLSMGVFAAPITVLWIVGITNAINLIDGLDGLAGGVVFFAAITNLIVAYVTGATFVALTMSAVLGAVLGFLVFNFNPARIFMGDSGSYFLGFVLGTMSLAGASQKASTAVSLLVPVLALGLPIFDTLFSIVRRFLERRPLFSPDRGHIHHRLLDMGVTHRRAVLLLYAVSTAFTATAITVSLGRSWTVGVALLVATIVVVGLVRFLGYFELLLLARGHRTRPSDVELLRRAVPPLLERLATAESERAVLEELAGLLASADVQAIEILVRGTEDQLWQRDATADSAGEFHTSARFALGDDHSAVADVRFRWCSDAGSVSAQADILLQLIVDCLANRLARAKSPLVPAAAPKPTSSTAAPVPVQPIQVDL